jgi:arginyl-tRNA synthetase
MKDYLQQQLEAVLAGIEGVPDDFVVEFQTPNNPEHGDLATNAALQLARPLRRAPRQIAEDLVRRLGEGGLDRDRIDAVEIAGPGFLNFRFSDRYLARSLDAILQAGEAYGRADRLGRTALVEYVSANPTGPLTVGHGRNAVLGDTIANLLDWVGYDVTREYYFNDGGRQMQVLGESVRARYRALVDPAEGTKQITLSDGAQLEVPASFPYNGPKDHGYLGDYIIDIARQVADEHGDAWLAAGDVTPFKEAAEQAIFAEIAATLLRLGIKMDTFFNEHTLYTSNRVWTVLDAMREQGFVYDRDGAVWFKTTAFDKEKDTVLFKSSGEPTYRLPDIAYHADKLDRGFDKVVDVFGADHILTYPDVLSGLRVMGYDADRVDVVHGQSG